METLTEKLQHDPLIGKHIPGQSLTASQGTMPYEQPPQTVSPEIAFKSLKAGLYQRKAQQEIGMIAKAGISCETLASSMVMMAFSQGMFNPDVAEIIKPFLALEIFKIAKEQGVDQVILENKPIDKGLDEDALESLRSEASPENKFNISFTPEEQQMMLVDLGEEKEEPEVPQEGFMSKPREVI